MNFKYLLLVCFNFFAIQSFADFPVGKYLLKSGLQNKSCINTLQTSYSKNKLEYMINSLDNLNQSEVELDIFYLDYPGTFDLIPNGLSHTVTCPGSHGEADCWIKKYEFNGSKLKITTTDLIVGGDEVLKSVCDYEKK